MKKRYTDADKWTSSVYRELSSSAKLLWSWLNDNCDNAGIITPDIKLASFQIGQTIDESHLGELRSRLQKISKSDEPDTYWIRGFIAFQFGALPAPGTKAKMAPLHGSIWNSLAAHNMAYTNPKNIKCQLTEASLTPQTTINEPSADCNGNGNGNGNEMEDGKKPKKPNLPYRFVSLWAGRYFKQFNVVYTGRKRDYSEAKRLMQETKKTPEELVSVAADAWKKAGQGFWACENKTRKISDFCTEWNRINVELYGNKTKRTGGSGGFGATDRNAGTLNNPNDYAGITEKL